MTSVNSDNSFGGPGFRSRFDPRGNVPNMNAATTTTTIRPNPQSTTTAESNQARAARYEDEKRRIIQSCFSKKEDDGVLLESYITHVRVTEDAAYPSTPPPPESSATNKKSRLILVAVRKSGRVRVHKARENPTGTFSIGKTWALDELSAIHIYTGYEPNNEKEILEKQWAGDLGFTVTLGKPYYWHAPTAKEKDFFIASLLKIYKKYTGGKTPDLTGFSPHQMQQFGANSSRTPSESVSHTPPLQSTPPRPPVPALGAQRPQSPIVQRPSPGPPARFDQSHTSLPRSDARPATREGPASPTPEQFHSPMRMERKFPSRENLRRSPEVASPPLAYRDLPPAVPPLPLRTSAPNPIYEQPTPQMLDSREMQGYPPVKSTNGFTQYPKPPPEPSNTSSDFLPTALSNRARSPSSTQLSDRPATATSIATSTSSQAPPVPQLVPDRKRPFLQQPELAGSRSNLNTGSNSEFVTPATTPSAVKSEPSEAFNMSEETINEKKVIPPKQDYFTAVTVPVGTDQKTATNETQSSPPEQLADKLTIPTITTAEPEEVSSPPDSSEEHRPGLGPMVKKKEVADRFRKAAMTATAFKPRQGGGAARLKAMQEEGKKGNEPDGITGVVPAPLLRGMSSDSVASNRPTTPATPGFREIPVSPLPNAQAPKAFLQRTATEDSIASQPSEIVVPQDQPVPSKELPPPHTTPSPQPQPHERQEPVPERPPSPEKARSRSPQRRKRQRQEADIAKYSSPLGIDPRIFGGRGADFNDLLTEFGWHGRLDSKQKIDDLETEVKREIGRAQATGWLGHVEQQESKVQELAKAFDRAIEECEELDGLFTLYSHELDTLTADIEYIEAQSQGLQVQTANQKLLYNELQGLLKTLTIPKAELQDIHYGSLDDARGVASVERSLSLLYRALITIDPDIRQNKQRTDGQGSNADRSGVGVYADRELGQMRAVRDQKHQYRDDAQAFIRRFTQHMGVCFKRLEQSHDEDSLRPVSSDTSPSMNLAPQRAVRQDLWLYNGMMLFIREVNTYEWKALVKSYEINMLRSYQEPFRQRAMISRREARKPSGDEQEALFTSQEKEKLEESLTSTAARKLTVKRGKTTKNSTLKPSLSNKQEGKPEAYEIFQNILEQQAKVVAEEQNFIVSFFHLNSQSNADFSEIVSARAPQDRRPANLSTNLKYEPDRENALLVYAAIEGIFGFWLQDLQGLLEWVLGSDQLQGVGVLYALEHVSFTYEDTYQEFITANIKKLHDKLNGLFHKFVDEQIKAIEETKVKVKKRKGIISFMRTFPVFSTTVESMLPAEVVDHDNLEIRFVVNEAYTRILKAMWESLMFIAKDDATTGGASHSTAPASGDPEDKEALNYHILLIENMNHYVEEVDTHRNVVLEEWKQKASHDMYIHLNQYTDAVIRRPLGKWLDFIESTEAMMKSNDSYSNISGKPSHSRSACKKVIKSYDAGEVRKGIETLKRRVEKHFGDVDEPSAMGRSLIARVFEECSLRYEHGYDRMKLIIDKVYDGSLDIDWKKEEVSSMFKR